MTEWAQRTLAQRQVIDEAKKRNRQQHYADILDKEREKNRRYRAQNREKIRLKAREAYVKKRELAGLPVRDYTPRETPEPEAPAEVARRFGSLDKICTVER